MDIVKATKLFEEWLGNQLTLVPVDISRKHQNMTSKPLIFLRATYYRWAQIWPELCADLAEAPTVLAVADLHVENFGTWRDLEGRLIWGVNDVDEAYPLPYTSDLVRLATSAALLRPAGLRISLPRVCDSIMLGYMKGLTKGTRPFVLAEKHNKLRRMALSRLRNPKLFWQRMGILPQSAKVPVDAAQILHAAMPNDVKYVLRTRQAGEGSLGRQRFLAMGEMAGSLIAREVKEVAPSAVAWARSLRSPKIYYQQILDTAVRMKDPYLRLQDRWIVRRLAPDCSRIDLAGLSAMADREALLKAMGRETANVHLGVIANRDEILADLSRRKRYWLEDAVALMLKAVIKDFRKWREWTEAQSKKKKPARRKK